MEYHSKFQQIKLLKNINLNIPVNCTVGIIGPTGCGKTTINVFQYKKILRDLINE